MTASLFTLDQRIMMVLADALVVGWVDEEMPSAFVRFTVVDRGRSRRLAPRQATFAEGLTRELQLPQPVRASPYR